MDVVGNFGMCMISPDPGPVIIASTMCRSLVSVNLVPLHSFGASGPFNKMTGNPTGVVNTPPKSGRLFA